MRATQHSGRVGKTGKGYSTKHNDRSFLEEAEADNIDQNRTPLNVTWQCYQNTNPELTFEEAESAFYEQVFSAVLEKTNEKYKKSRHSERCKSMDEWRKSRQHCPEEVILQIGNMDASVPDSVFKECVSDYLRELNKYSGQNMQVLDLAVHLDEAVPHAHIRRVWMCQDKDGMWTTGQEKALEALGVELPNRGECPSKTNNRKKTFDAHMRETWLNICEAHGINIDREPIPDARHNRTKEQYIRDKMQDMQERTKELESGLTAGREKLDALSEQAGKKEAELVTLQRDIDELASVELLPPDKSLLGKDKDTITLPYDEYANIHRRAVAVDKLTKAQNALKSDLNALGVDRSTLEAEKRQIRANLEESERLLQDAERRNREAPDIKADYDMLCNDFDVLEAENEALRIEQERLQAENKTLNQKLRELPFMEWLAKKVEPVRDLLNKLFYAERIIEHPECEEASRERKLANMYNGSVSLAERLSKPYSTPYTEPDDKIGWRYNYVKSGRQASAGRDSFIRDYYKPLAEQAGIFADKELIEQARAYQQELNLNQHTHGRSR